MSGADVRKVLIGRGSFEIAKSFLLRRQQAGGSHVFRHDAPQQQCDASSQVEHCNRKADILSVSFGG
jgi:hypothetical protein